MSRHPHRQIAAILLALFVLTLSAGIVRAVKTGRVDFGEDGEYDMLVYVERDTEGILRFCDRQVPSPVSLNDLVTRSHFDSGAEVTGRLVVKGNVEASSVTVRGPGGTTSRVGVSGVVVSGVPVNTAVSGLANYSKGIDLSGLVASAANKQLWLYMDDNNYWYQSGITAGYFTVKYALRLTGLLPSSGSQQQIQFQNNSGVRQAGVHVYGRLAGAFDGTSVTLSNGILLGGGAHCDGAVWSDASSRDLKTNLTDMAPEEAWGLIDAMRVRTFQYRRINPHWGRWTDPSGGYVIDSETLRILSDETTETQRGRADLAARGYRRDLRRRLEEPEARRRLGFVAEELAAADARLSDGASVGAGAVAALNTAALQAAKVALTEERVRRIALERRVDALEAALADIRSREK